MAEGYSYYKLTGISISEDNKWAAYGVDTVSRRIYTIYFKNLETGEILPQCIENTEGVATWANDNKTVFYTTKDKKTLRPDKIFKHKLGTNAIEDSLVFHEKDDTFNTSVYKTKSLKFIVIESNSTMTTEYQILRANTPSSVIDFNMKTKTKEIKKEQQVLGGKFDKNNYVEERIWATATDGTKVPISMVYRKEIKKDGTNPLLLYAYGSYGISMDPYFSSTRLSLLDRGFIFAIAHIRGGEDLGRQWYEDGKLLKKKNTFTDFIDCSKYVIEQNYTSPKHLYAEGGSAGGLLMGAIVNMAPELYNGVIAQVPFVDVMTTMLDDSIPLTTGEYDEWGNPNVKKYYDYMKSYSPYDNVKPQAYPNMYVSTGLHDSQVQYWEPAKWVAKLRMLKTNDNLLFLNTNMDAGHGGASGRFEALKELAKEFSFLVDLERIKAN
jgi:protease II